MDKSRRILLILLGILLTACLSAILFTLKNQALTRYRTACQRYEQQILELQKIGGNKEQLLALRDQLKIQLEREKSRHQTVIFKDIFDFSEEMLKKAASAGLKVTHFRFHEEELLEFTFSGSPSAIYRYITVLNSLTPAVYTTSLRLQRDKSSLKGEIRIGYE